MIATLPMYDWPEQRAKVDARWSLLRDALRVAEIDVPQALTRPDEKLSVEDLWTASDLVVGETCSWPLATTLKGKVRYLATLDHGAPGCTPGLYRSVIIAQVDDINDTVPAPSAPGPAMPSKNISGSVAANSPQSLSGYVALKSDFDRNGLAFPIEDEIEWTGSHRASVRAVAEGRANYAAIDAVSWDLARQHEPASKRVKVIGWTASRPALPLITNLATTDAQLAAMRDILLDTLPCTVHADPLAGLGV